jgi:hypothetical protein
MYTNIPKQDTINIIKDILQNEQYPNLYIQTMIRMLTTIIDQDFFHLNNKIYQQKKKGYPWEPHFHQYLLKPIYRTQNTISLLIYYKTIKSLDITDVDDILLVNNEQVTVVNSGLKQFSEMSLKLEFTIEKEKDNIINFLGITFIEILTVYNMAFVENLPI